MAKTPIFNDIFYQSVGDAVDALGRFCKERRMKPAEASSHPVQPRKGSKGEATRRSILDAAERCFAQLGYDAARLESIADEVGIKQAGIFYYFPSKQVLFNELVQGIQASLIMVTEQRLKGAVDPWERLMLLVEAWIDYMVARPTAARILLRGCADAPDAQENPSSYSSSALQLLRDIIAEGITTRRFADVHSMYLLNLLTGSILHYVCNPEQLGFEHAYKPDDPMEVAAFKSVLRKTARAVLDIR